jgi:hypothetical protein
MVDEVLEKQESKREQQLRKLAEAQRRFATDPVFFVQTVLQAEPSDQQKEILNAVVQPGCRVTVRSGHGTGKTACFSWLILWHVCCFEDSRVFVTAPSAPQLFATLWKEVAKWHDHMLPWYKDQIEVTGDEVRYKDKPHDRFAVARTARMDSPTGLQGAHATNMLFLVDEAAGVPEPIFDTIRGAMSTAGSRMVLAGNPTALNGFFYRTHCEEVARLWHKIALSGLNAPKVDRKFIEEIVADAGEDSDEYRIRILGEFPRVEASQLISPSLVDASAKRILLPENYDFNAVILGVDVAWMGNDRSCIYMRQGLFSRCLGVYSRMDNMTLADRVAQFIEDYKADGVFIDTGWGSGVIDRLRQLKYIVHGVNFGGVANNEVRYHNKRSEIWFELRKWLEDGGAVEESESLKNDLISPRYGQTAKGKILLESKDAMRRRGIKSPDVGDALAMTFSSRVNKRVGGVLSTHNLKAVAKSDFDPFE